MTSSVDTLRQGLTARKKLHSPAESCSRYEPSAFQVDYDLAYMEYPGTEREIETQRIMALLIKRGSVDTKYLESRIDDPIGIFRDLVDAGYPVAVFYHNLLAKYGQVLDSVRIKLL